MSSESTPQTPNSRLNGGAIGAQNSEAGPRALLERLVAFDTTSHKSNLELIDFVSDYLARLGVASELVPSQDGLKASLSATIGPSEVPGIGLSGHTDVVPVEGQIWQSDPFQLSERDGRLYGRGTADMKGFLACVLASVPRFLARPLSAPIQILFSYDEEVGCTGVRPMIDLLGTHLPKPRIVIVGEPTSLSVVDAHKGALRCDATVTGHEAHSSLAHHGVNAISYAARLIGELDRVQEEIRRSSRQNPLSSRFDPPYTTVHVGLIEGGTALNIVPKDCRFVWEIRPLPGFDVDQVIRQLEGWIERECRPAMRAISANADIGFEMVNTIPAFYSGDGSPAVSLALALAGQNQTYAVSYCTEAGLFQTAGCASVICGPGDIAVAHKPDEYVELAQLEACMVMLDRLARQLAV